MQNVKQAECSTLVTVVTALDVIALCDAGRYREAVEMSVFIAPESDGLLALGMLETARGNLEAGKDYLTRAADVLNGDLLVKAQTQLAFAYCRGGETAECRVLLESVPADCFDRLLIEAIIETELKPERAIATLARVQDPLSPGMEARLHNQRALALRKLGELDRAIQEYEAAIYWFEQLGSDCLPLVINNLARVYMVYGQFEMAHRYVDRAIQLLEGDNDHLAKALDEKAQIYLAEHSPDALRFATKSVELLKKSDKLEWMVESLRTLAQAHGKDGDCISAAQELEKAKQICERLGRKDLLVAVLTTWRDMAHAVYETRDVESINLALELSNGKLRPASKLLGFNSHQVLMKRLKKYRISSK